MNSENNIAQIDSDLDGVNNEDIKSLIYTIRGKQVILDCDIARQYGVETKRVNEAVKRNYKRFPKEFCFQLTENEVSELKQKFIEIELQKNMRSQFATAPRNDKCKKKYK